MILGRFDGSDALAAVGSTGSLIAMMTDLFIGLSVGEILWCPEDVKSCLLEVL